ncbi:MAG TPA: response regulator [Gemmatimonadales bacterium]|nr:response regulator [Gemmatimonadales bacterium]
MEQALDILLVDDNENDITLARKALGAVSFVNRLQVVHDGLEALAYLRRQPPYQDATLPHIVLLDINMPRLNGFETLEAIKADPALRALPVIMLTVSSRDEDIIKSYRRGACTYVRKPLEFSEFVEAMQRLELYWSLGTIPKI